ncbi:MAG TPA: amino acid permease [Alphaproteobacteria bacterium]|nr:amino acid permease [Alphaproteobacteria bacterium]
MSADDVTTLRELGYAQELLRGMRSFQNFAVSFAIICILAGGINSFGQATGSLGGGAVGIGWIVGATGSMFVALAMAQIGSAYPTAGGLYHWGSILGGRGFGWLTAWLNLIGLVAVMAAINVGTFTFLVGAILPEFGIDPAVGAGLLNGPVQAATVAVIAVTQGLLNHYGIRLTTRVTDLSGYLIFAVSIILAAAALAYAPHIEISRLWTFTNFSGDAGGGVWPQSDSLLYLFILCLMLPAFTITGFDASAHTAEETVGASRAVPGGIIHSVLWSGLFGWVMLCAIIVAAPDLKDAAAQGANSIFAILREILPKPLRLVLWVGILIAQYCAGLATVTSASRMIYAFSRDGGLPWSRILRRVNTSWHTPVAAIWTAVALSTAFTLYTPVYTTIVAVSVIFLYISYAMPIGAGLIVYGHRWTRMGPFNLGWAYRPIAMVSLVFCGVLLYSGVQPPNDQALTVTIGALVLAALIWFGAERRRFKGPPVIRTRAEADSELPTAEVAPAEA